MDRRPVAWSERQQAIIAADNEMAMSGLASAAPSRVRPKILRSHSNRLPMLRRAAVRTASNVGRFILPTGKSGVRLGRAFVFPDLSEFGISARQARVGIEALRDLFAKEGLPRIFVNRNADDAVRVLEKGTFGTYGEGSAAGRTVYGSGLV